MYGLAARAVQHLGGRADLSLSDAARRHDSTTARALTAQDVAFSLTIAEGEGPSDHHAVAARLRRRRGDRRRDRGACASRRKRARDVPLFVAGAADLLARLLFDAPVRRIDARSAARLRRLQGRPLRGRPLHRIRPRQGLVGRRAAGRARAEQFRHRALRVLPRPRRRLRRLHRQELSVPRGIHLAHLGDALRFSRPSRTAASSATCCPTTRRPARRAGSSTRGARSSRIRALREALDRRLRFRMDQQEHHVRLLRAHPFGVPELRHDGGRQAGRRRARAARAVPRQGAGRGVRRAVRAAGVRRFGAGSRAAAQGDRSCSRRPACRQGRQAGRRRRASRSPSSSCSTSRRSSRTTCRSSRISRRSASMRPCAWSIRCSTAARVDDFDFDITMQRFSFSSDAGRFAAHLFLLPGGRDEGLAKSCRHRRSGDRRADRRASSRPRRGPSW